MSFEKWKRKVKKEKWKVKVKNSPLRGGAALAVGCVKDEGWGWGMKDEEWIWKVKTKMKKKSESESEKIPLLRGVRFSVGLFLEDEGWDEG